MQPQPLNPLVPQEASSAAPLTHTSSLISKPASACFAANMVLADSLHRALLRLLNTKFKGCNLCMIQSHDRSCLDLLCMQGVSLTPQNEPLSHHARFHTPSIDADSIHLAWPMNLLEVSRTRPD